MSNSQYRTAPTYELPVMTGDKTTAIWYRYFQANELGQPPDNESPITVGASPFTYTATRKGFAIVTGGTVSNIQLARVGIYTTGQTSGIFPLAAGDMLKITYSGTPAAVTFFPI
jgi:hypothetical protein